MPKQMSDLEPLMSEHKQPVMPKQMSDMEPIMLAHMSQPQPNSQSNPKPGLKAHLEAESVLESNLEFELSSNFDPLTESELEPKEAFDLVPLGTN